jgi:hypothetical protein
MTRPYKVLSSEESYTFSKYFELPYTPEEILGDLGYALCRTALNLPRFTGEISFLSSLEKTLSRNLRIVNPIAEISRREVIVAPILLEVCDYCNLKLESEYTIRVSDWLKGTIDYLIQDHAPLLVIEAKQSDLSRGFTQLATELIAFAQRVTELETFYGVVTTGEVWRFGRLDRANKTIYQDTIFYSVPRELGTVVSALVGILAQASSSST